MNREIKFRGLRTDGKGWVYGVPFYIPSERKCFIIDNCQSLNLTQEDSVFYGKEVHPESVGQYLGFKASGTDVYAGDLIGYYGSTEGREIGYSKDGRLVWKTPHGHFTISAIELHDELQMQVIGNIHEHKI